ncbi:hypothetical protein NW762_004040 [Fusarium torreyae]|uniref:Apple domain-containing protein n=1 Tax=Fusarium torreyae TaxID=1237075 RepID=A0A9W8S5A1_9HYPO|nr:hypothetical protein NW762_004040 [Fusarium torreyae]
MDMNTNDQTSPVSESSRTSAVGSEFSSLDIAPTEAQTEAQNESEAPSSGSTTGSVTDTIVTSLEPTTDIISSAFPTSTSIVEPPGRAVIILIQESNNQKRGIKKRATRGFIGTNNPEICTFASTFNLAEGQLFFGGVPTFYSGEGYKELGNQAEAPLTRGAITRTFETTGRALVFRNPNLPNGEAGFCQDSSGQVYITFSSSPPECLPVTLAVYDVAQCQDGRLVGFGTSTSSGTVSSETSTAEEISSGSASSEEPTIAETTVASEYNSASSSQTEPSNPSSKTLGSEASTGVSSKVVDSSATRPITHSFTFFSNSSTKASSSTELEVLSSLTSTTIGLPITTSVALAGSTSQTSSEPSGPASSSIFSSREETTSNASATSSESSEIAASTTETTTATDFDTTTASTKDSTTDLIATTTTGFDTTTASTEDSTTDLIATTTTGFDTTTASTEDSTTDLITTTTTGFDTTTASTEDSTTDLMTTTTSVPEPDSCASDSNPYTDSGATFDLFCSFDVTGGSSIGVVQANSFNQCVLFCAESSSCAAIQYEKATMLCSGYSSITGTSANNSFDVAIKVVATATTTATV